MNFIQSLLPAIEHFHMIGYWIALFVALLETTLGVGLIMPGSTIILFMGTLAAKGYFDLGDLIWFAAIGAIIGDNINYFIGKKYGSKIFKKGFWFIKTKHFKKGEEFFQRHGSKSVFIGRFIPSIKEVIPLIAGTFGMKRLPFMIWNILGAIGWSLVWILPGYFFAQSIDVAKTWLTRAGFLLTILFIIFAIFYLLKVLFVKKGKDFFSFISSVWQSIKQAIIRNSEVQKFVAHHKKFFLFLQKRFDKNNFFGLPLTILFIALFYVLALFGGIVEDVLSSNIIVSIDVRVANLLTIFRNPQLTDIFLWITLLGKWQVIFIFTIAVIFILWLWKKQSFIIPFLLSIAGSEVFTVIGKHIFHRPRPTVAVYFENSFSFPSGHATIAMAFYGFLAYILIKNSKNWKFKINTFFITVMVILLIGFSRLYLGVHYISDVWGGYLVGAIWFIIGISLSEYLLSKKQKNNQIYLSVKKRLAVFVIILASAGFYIVFARYYQVPVSIISQKTDKKIVNNITTVLKNNQLRYTETLLGNKQEPLSFVIIAKNDSQLINIFGQAGWALADNVGIFSVYRTAKDAIFKRSYSQAPMTPYFWNFEVHEFGFEKETNSNNVRSRHHARFWKTKYLTENGENIYVGIASFDKSMKWGITHRINPDIDTEREYLFNDLKKTDRIAKTEKQQFINPKLGSNFSGDLFFTDGKLYLLFFK